MAAEESLRPEMVQIAEHFLKSTLVKDRSPESVRSFLSNKGLSAAEIEKAFSKSLELTKIPSSLSVRGQPQGTTVRVFALLSKFRDFCSFAFFAVAAFYGLHFLYEHYVRPWLTGRPPPPSPGLQTAQLQADITESLAQLHAAVDTLRRSVISCTATLQTPQADSVQALAAAVSDVKKDVASLRALLLKKTNFTPTPPVARSIPDWQKNGYSATPAAAASTPAASTPAASTPAASTPAASTPAASTPAASTPAASTLAASTPAASTPAASTSAAGAVMSLSSGAGISSTSATETSRTSDVETSTTTAAASSATSGAETSPTAAAETSPTAAAETSPTAAAETSPTAAAETSPTAAAETSPTAAAETATAAPRVAPAQTASFGAGAVREEAAERPSSAKKDASSSGAVSCSYVAPVWKFGSGNTSDTKKDTLSPIMSPSFGAPLTASAREDSGATMAFSSREWE